MQLDHVVLWVRDPLRSLEFYVELLGLEPVRREAYAEGEAAFPSVRISDVTILDLMDAKLLPAVQRLTRSEHAGNPLNHLCISMDKSRYEAVVARLEVAGVDLRPGGEASFGAQGISRHSGYLCDPDDNIIEIRHYE